MDLDETIDLLGQISIYAGIAAIVLFAIAFILAAVVKAKNKSKAAASTSVADAVETGDTGRKG